ncbi:ATP-binding protein [Streptomyces sp. NPDC057474]|uniref:ATP-binding protein n=1 Tax=Streptomyces sp. NPDC057474 TaxID=3346144 RepID=UPI00368BA1BE
MSTVSPSWNHTLRLPLDPRSPGVARATLRAALDAYGLTGLAPIAELLTSELATNAVRANTTDGRDIGVGFELSGAGLRLEVADSGDGKPELRCAGDDEVCGRGLALVEALADDWGVASRDGVGKVVWASLAMSQRAGRPSMLRPCSAEGRTRPGSGTARDDQ